jgi:hypothetical protein
VSQAAIEQSVDGVRREALAAIAREEPLVVVEAPPGSGKTHLITDAAALARNRGGRIAIAAQTNSQADDICERIGHDFPQFEVVRFASNSHEPTDLGPTVSWEKKRADLPDGPCIVVATTAKWGFVDLENTPSFDYLLVDEAWQMAWAEFMLSGRQVAPRFIMVGDPGQISPVVTIDTSRWVTAPVPPQLAAPEVVRRMAAEGAVPMTGLQLPASRRLPHDTVELVRGFYDFEFDSWAQPGDRRFRAKRATGSAADPAIDVLMSGSIAGLTLPTPPDGPPLEEDREVAELAALAAARILERKSRLVIHDGKERAVKAEDIGISATHRVMNARMEQALPPELRGRVRVDTPERWQGLERPLMICVHPVSGVVQPSEFDLETGRLCVMASRHQVGLIIVTRDHLATTLHELVPSAEQGVGLPDLMGVGHSRHTEFWDALIERDSVVPANV